MACAGFLQRLWEKPIWEGVWPNLDPWDSVCFPTASMEWNVSGKYWPHGELFFFLIQKEPATLSGSETFSPFFNDDIRTPFFSADVLKKCALFALHVIAEEGRDGDGFQVTVVGDEWKMDCPKSPMWESAGEAWSEDADASSTASRDGNVCNDTLHVVGGPGDKISFFLAVLGVGKGGTKLSHGPGHFPVLRLRVRVLSFLLCAVLFTLLFFFSSASRSFGTRSVEEGLGRDCGGRGSPRHRLCRSQLIRQRRAVLVAVVSGRGGSLRLYHAARGCAGGVPVAAFLSLRTP